MNAHDDTQRYHAAAVAALGASPATIRRFLAGFSGVEAWERLRDGTHPEDPDAHYRQRTRRYTPALMAETCGVSGTRVLLLGDGTYPDVLAGDPQAPAVLFVTGRSDGIDLLSGAGRVAVVGTRTPTRYGAAIAEAMGYALASAGVVVISGLARGIDAAAHQGALAANRKATVVGVLGAAVDSPLPPPEKALRRAVAEAGVLLSEVPPGVAGSRWMFAVRNRIMAALAHVVVVVESHQTGGSMHTVRAARQRGVAVAAVPGSVHSSASAGPLRLIADHHALLVRGPDDVLAMVAARSGRIHGGTRPPGLVPSTNRRTGSGARSASDAQLHLEGQSQLSAQRRPRAKPQPQVQSTSGILNPQQLESAPTRPVAPVRSVVPTPVAQAVLGAVEHEPSTLDRIADRCGLSLGVVALGLTQLAEVGLAAEEHGWWVRVPTPVRSRFGGSGLR